MVKMENDVVIPSKPIFYCRFFDDIYSRRKLGDNVLFDQLNSYHPNIKLYIEVNPSKFLDTKLANINGTYKFNVYRKNTKLTSPWTSRFPKHYKQNTIMVIFIIQKEYHQTLTKKSLWQKKSLWRLITHCVSLTVMNFKRAKNVEMKVL